MSGYSDGPGWAHCKTVGLAYARLGNDPGSQTAALARIFRDANVARAELRKKPRASYRRFVYPAPEPRGT